MYGTFCLYGVEHNHFEASKFLLRGLERGALKIDTFLALKWQIAKQVTICLVPKKLKQQYIGNFMYMSLAADVPVVYMVWNIGNYFDGGKSILRAMGRGGPWNLDFLGPNENSQRVQKSLNCLPLHLLGKLHVT
jgi:hypothetical protein